MQERLDRGLVVAWYALGKSVMSSDACPSIGGMKSRGVLLVTRIPVHRTSFYNVFLALQVGVGLVSCLECRNISEIFDT